MSRLPFRQVDVFAAVPFKGNPLAVVIGADDLTDQQMATIARWTNLSETTFLLRPADAAADYRVRIFTPERELPFAGHPTLGTCHAWLEQGNLPKGAHVVQACGAGLIRIKRDGRRLAFAAPPRIRKGDVNPNDLARIAAGLNIDRSAIKAAQWADNGPGWVAVMLSSRKEVLGLKPDYATLIDFRLGVVAPWDPVHDGASAQFEIRAFIPPRATEDPVTGSLNASVAQWLIEAGLAPETYVAAQGTALGRDGRVYITRVRSDIWVGGDTVSCIEGSIAV